MISSGRAPGVLGERGEHVFERPAAGAHVGDAKPGADHHAHDSLRSSRPIFGREGPVERGSKAREWPDRFDALYACDARSATKSRVRGSDVPAYRDVHGDGLAHFSDVARRTL